MDDHSKIAVRGTKASVKGRYLSAQQSFAPGDVIARFSSPVSVQPTTATYTTTCHGCFRRSHQLSPPAAAAEAAAGTGEPGILRPCTGCRGAWYCSKACQRHAWRAAGHKTECKVLKRVGAAATAAAADGRFRDQGALPTAMRALVSIVADEAKWRDVADKLLGHEELEKEDNEEAWRDMEMQARMVRHLLGSDPEWVGEGEAVVLERYVGVLWKISTNAFKVTDTDLGNDSMFLDTTLAMANHSCVPNTSAQIFGRKAVLIAERPIEKNHEITISYVDTSQTKSQRQEYLDGYYFTCTCQRCRDDLTVYQVCSASPNLKANEFSLCYDIEALRNPAVSDPKLINSGTARLTHTREAAMSMENSFTFEATNSGAAVKPAMLLQKQFGVHRPFVEAGAWAYLDTFLQDCLALYTHQKKLLEQVAICSLVATRVHPFLHPNPFAVVRLKSAMSLVCRLPQAMADDDDDAGGGGGGYRARLAELAGRTGAGLSEAQLDELGGMDFVAAGRMMLFMMLEYKPSAQVEDWPFWDEVKAGHDALHDPAQWPDPVSRTAMEMWERREPADVFIPAWKQMVGKIDRFADIGARLVVKDFDPLRAE